MILSRAVTFSYLDVPQLLKHALGIKRASGPNWCLRYLYLDAPVEAKQAHADEITRFVAAVGHELRFRAFGYRDFVASLGAPLDGREIAYFDYIAGRYLNAAASGADLSGSR